MKGIKQSFDKITSKVQNQIKGCVQCTNNDCEKCKHRNFKVDEIYIPPPPGCCDLKVIPYFGFFTEPLTSTEYITNPFTIATTDNVSPCQITLEFNVTNYDGECSTYLNINGIDVFIPNGIPIQYYFNDQDVIYFKTLHRGIDCSNVLVNCLNVSCNIDYGIVFAVNFGDPACDFCPAWVLNPIQLDSTTIFTEGMYGFPVGIPGWTWANTTNQPIVLYFDPTIIASSGGTEQLDFLEVGVPIHQLINGNTLSPFTYTAQVGAIIGLVQSGGSGCFKTETFITNLTCNKPIGSKIIENYICP